MTGSTNASLKHGWRGFALAVAACLVLSARTAMGQELDEQVQRLREPGRQSQYELEQLKASNQAMQAELIRLRGGATASPLPNPSNQAASADKNGEAAAPASPSPRAEAEYLGSSRENPVLPLFGAGAAGHKLLGGVSREDGFYIRNEDDTFSLHIHNRLQMRYAYEHFFDETTRNGKASFDRQEDRSDFHIARNYLTFNGHAWSKDLFYQATLEAFTAANENVRLRYSWLDFNLLHGVGWVGDYSPWRNALTLRAGLWKGRFGREFPASDGQLQFVDRALATQAFNEGRLRGVEAHGSLIYFDEDLDNGKTSRPGRLAYYVEVADSINNAGQAFNLDNSSVSDSARFPRQVDSLPAIASRLQYDVLRGFYSYALPDGSATRANDFRFNEANDLAYHEEPALQIGASYLFQPDDFDAQPADFPLQGRFFKGKNIQRCEADVAFKYRGVSLTGEYYYENIGARPGSVYSTFNIATGLPIPKSARSSQVSQGFYIRGGYFLIPRTLEIAGRVSGLFTGDLADRVTPAAGTPGTPGFRPAMSTPGLPVPGAWEYTLGLGYYPTGHHYLKIQVDCSYLTNNPLSAEKSEFLSANRESDLIVRSQLQLEF